MLRTPAAAEWTREEVAVDAAPHLSGVAALRPARMKGQRRKVSGITERGGGEIEGKWPLFQFGDWLVESGDKYVLTLRTF